MKTAIVNPTKEYSLQDHLNEVLKEILVNEREKGFDEFEKVSIYVKQKMTKLSFQYATPKREVTSKIDLTNYEQEALVAH